MATQPNGDFDLQLPCTHVRFMAELQEYVGSLVRAPVDLS